MRPAVTAPLPTPEGPDTTSSMPLRFNADRSLPIADGEIELLERRVEILTLDER